MLVMCPTQSSSFCGPGSVMFHESSSPAKSPYWRQWSHLFFAFGALLPRGLVRGGVVAFAVVSSALLPRPEVLLPEEPDVFDEGVLGRGLVGGQRRSTRRRRLLLRLLFAGRRRGGGRRRLLRGRRRGWLRRGNLTGNKKIKLNRCRLFLVNFC